MEKIKDFYKYFKIKLPIYKKSHARRAITSNRVKLKFGISSFGIILDFLR